MSRNTSFMIRKLLGLSALCFLLLSCNNIFHKLADNNSADGGQKRFIVVFDRNGGDKEAYPGRKAVVAPATTIVTLPVPPARSGHTFSGWNTVADGSGTVFTATTTVTESCTVYAQ